jgi:hypothetical protein
VLNLEFHANLGQADGTPMVLRATIILVFIFSLSIVGLGQSYGELIAKVRSIKLLEANREVVQRILADFNTEEREDHFRRYYRDDVDIRVFYSNGSCSDDPEEDDDSAIWDVSEWTVTKIEIEPNNRLPIKELPFDLTKFRKEQRYRDSPDLQFYHDKGRGLALETDEDVVQNIIFLPPSSLSKKVCKANTFVKSFYNRESWFDRKLDERLGCVLINQHADVEDLALSSNEIEATSIKSIKVTTTAVDPEGDVLTYNYNATAGQIIGTGARVVWDLTGVKAGIYSITVGVDDGAGIVGRTVKNLSP